jgi:hypothetical protein
MPLVSKTFSQIITFTRASTATYFDSAGVLQSAAIDAPRLDYNPSTLAAQGLLIEESRANRFANSSASGSVTLGTGTSIAPDGNLMSKAVCLSGAASFPNIGAGGSNTQSFTLSAGQTIDVALSGYFAAGTAGMVIEPRFIADARTAPSSNFTYAELQINTSTWTVRTKSLGVDWSEVQAPSITLFRAGVYRVTWVVRYTQGATIRDTTGVTCQLRDSAGSGTFTGDGIGHFQYFGIQGETGSFPTSTILTTTAAATRAADVASVNTLSPWYNATEGTLYAEGVPISPSSSFTRVAAIEDSAFNSVISIQRNGTDARGFGDGASTIVSSSMPQNTVFKAALAAKINDFALSANGSAVNPDTTTNALPTANRLGLGATTAFTSYTNLWLQRITYYPRRLSNAELQAITA